MTHIQRIKELILNKKIVTIKEIYAYLKTNARMTVLRRLQELSYMSSYSHKGKFYTIGGIPKYSKDGLWSYRSVQFSKYGTLINTSLVFINNSESGYTVKELQKKLHADVKLPLLKLFKNRKLHREKYQGEYVYFAQPFPRRKQQKILRQHQADASVLNIGKLTTNIITDELKAAVVLFYSILDEKQQRMYAGLESIKIGHGGDKLISKLLKIDPETVSKGRKELTSGNFEKERIRKQGAGRTTVKKNSRDNRKN